MRYLSEAHLSPGKRGVALVTYLRKPKVRRSLLGWSLFVAFWLMNEMRGIAVAKEVWPIFFGS